MFRIRRPFPSLFLVAALALGACGQKGPLYLPADDENQDKKTQQRQNN